MENAPPDAADRGHPPVGGPCFQPYPDGLVTNVHKGAVPMQAHRVARYGATYVVSPPIAVRRLARDAGE